MHRLKLSKKRNFVLCFKELRQVSKRCPVLYQRLRAKIAALPI
jgi:hypothetical protein